MRIAAAVLALGLMATSAYADLSIGESAARKWFICTDKDLMVSLLDTQATEGFDAAFAKFKASDKCSFLGVAFNMKVVSLVKATPFPGKEWKPGVPLTVSVLEVIDPAGDTVYAITGEPIVENKS